MPAHNPSLIPFLIIVLGGMPGLGVLSYFRLKSGKPLPPKARRYRFMIAIEIVLLGYSLRVARESGIRLLGSVAPAWGWAIALLYLGLIALRLHGAWKRLGSQRKQRARLLLPESPAEMRYWVPISLLAGFAEECGFRGMAYLGLRELTGSVGISVTVCALSFALAHMLQGWRVVLGTALVALLMHGIVYITTGLYLAIAVHAAYDLIVGVVAMRNFVRDDAAAARQPLSAN